MRGTLIFSVAALVYLPIMGVIIDLWLSGGFSGTNRRKETDE